MIDLDSLSRTGRPLILPGAHDALTARIIEKAGFGVYGIGGSALANTQLALPDAGLQSFGEYKEAVARIISASKLPVMVDGENGFGDVKSVVRTVQDFEAMGIDSVAFEDLVMPVRLGHPSSVVPREEIYSKLKAAINARSSDNMYIVGRTDSAYAVSLEEGIERAREYEAIGVDAITLPGLPTLDAYKKLRDNINIPVLAVIVPSSPWFAPSVEELISTGIEAAIYPAAILPKIVSSIQEGLDDIQAITGTPSQPIEHLTMNDYLDVEKWTAIDQGLD